MSQHDPSEPIEDCRKECTAEERSALDARTPPYDGIRTWGDLEAVRAKAKKRDERQNDNA